MSTRKISRIFLVLFYKKNIKDFSLLIYRYISSRRDWENSKLCALVKLPTGTPLSGSRVSTQFLIFLIFTPVTVCQSGKRYEHKDNSETDMKTKQPGINFVPIARQGFRTMYWSKCIVLFPCLSLLICPKNFENKLSYWNDGGSKFCLDFGESYCVPVRSSQLLDYTG